ncbi:MAG: endolytic transglycosylase MltG [Mariprofundaceae bacterium]|nr:endolytic transglycosylase MltG [Mariprofundaceae bacterium]
MKGGQRFLLVTSLLAGLLLSGFVAVQLWLPVQTSTPQLIMIAPGSSANGIASKLEKAGVIRSALSFRLLARLRGESMNLQSGEYRFDAPATISGVLDRLRRGDVVLHKLTVPEGLRNDEVLALLAERTGLSLTLWQKAFHRLVGEKEAEGLLLPETYTYRLPVHPHGVLLDMIRAQHVLLQTLIPGWLDVHGLRVVASIVEKETALDKERPLIAAVIRNRLARRMALQMDPTVIYGLWREDGGFSGNLRKRDLGRDTPWNSYTRKGLPPTPICNPGAASIRAAARPADVAYLYFVADGSGGHAFASSLEEHNRNVRQWIKLEKSR